MQKITPFLWFDNQAEDAAKLYVSTFANSKVLEVTRVGEAGPGPKGRVMTVRFQLEGVEFMALNGGPHFQLTEAVSFLVDCKTQDEVDRLWAKLAEGGSPSRCGWLKDRFGLSWQIVPSALPRMLADEDAARAGRVMKAMLGMEKLDIAELQRAYDSPA